ncbi:MAG: hypothetical protein WBO54_14525 [Thermoanaerobaculia bacterium]
MRTTRICVTAALALLWLPTAAPAARYRSTESAQPEQESAERQLPVLETGPGAAQDLAVEAECSQTEIGWADVVFSWSMPEGAFARQRLDVTSYRNGFELGEYELFVRPTPKYDPPYRKESEDSAPEQEAEEVFQPRITMMLQAIEPGGNDFWRVLTLTSDGWVPSEVARVELPVCPVDFDNE